MKHQKPGLLSTLLAVGVTAAILLGCTPPGPAVVVATARPTRPTAPSPPLPATRTPVPPTPAPAVNRTTQGRIQWDEIWRGEIRIVGDIIVAEGATLTIEPGTVVRVAANQDAANLFDWPYDMQQGVKQEHNYEYGVHLGEPYRDEGHHISIHILGTLHAVGTPQQMITITSDGPNPGIYDWNHLAIAHGVLSYSVVEYYRCMDPGDGTMISHNILRHVGECAVCANSSAVVEHNTISYAGHELVDMHNSSPTIRNNYVGPNPGHGGITIDGGAPQVVNNTIENCGVGIAFISAPGNPTIQGNTFSNNGEDIAHNY
ncbi:MAG: right-handed parallel beta-helix repeat-containing protein [Chloroflexi bacterium]|nr:right-handed parallel beta-helix repeat-containing protein [Chloroflexota bacterium]